MNCSHVRGFTVVELLVAMTITLAVAAVIVAAAQPARDAFDRVPAELDLQQRGRTALEGLTQAVRAADIVSFADPDGAGSFASMTTIVPVASAAQGVLDVDQTTPGGPITLAVAPCPNVKDVCGFTNGAAAVITQGGTFDVFIVSATDAGARRLSPDRALSRAYPRGSAVLEIEASTFRLDEQTDGTYSLIRETAAGAVQPVVDFLADLVFSVQVQQVDVAFTVHAPSEALRRVVPDRAFRASIQRRNGQ